MVKRGGNTVALPFPYPPIIHHRTVQSSPVQINEQASNPPEGWGYHDNCVLLQLPWMPPFCCQCGSDASCSSCLVQLFFPPSLGLEGFIGGAGGLAGSGFIQVPRGAADSGPNSGANTALGHSETGVVGGVGGGVEEVIVLVVVVVVVVRSRYH